MKLYFSVILKNIQALVDPRKFPKEYAGAYPLKMLPIFFEKTQKSTFDPHCVYQVYWPTQRITRKKMSNYHVDISSDLSFLTQLSAILSVIQLECRSPKIKLSDCNWACGNIFNLPFSDQSLKSLSCLHAIEHIGLGSYGDPLKKDRCWNALSELQRIVAPKGNLILSVPVGQPAVYFNANYIFNAQDIGSSLVELELAEFSFVDDDVGFYEYGIMEDTLSMKYALGLFHYRRTKH